MLNTIFNKYSIKFMLLFILSTFALALALASANVVKSQQTTIPMRKILQKDQEFVVLLIGSPIPHNLKSIGMVVTYLENATDYDCYINHPPPHSITEGGELPIAGYSGIRKGEGDTCIYIPLMHVSPDSEENSDIKEFESYTDEKFLFLERYIYENLDRLNRNVFFTYFLTGLAIFHFYLVFVFFYIKMKKPEMDQKNDIEMGVVR